MTMRSGPLRHRIRIQNKTVTQNEYGEEEATWNTFVRAWASVEPLLGRQYLEARAQAQSVSHKVRMRYRDGVTPEMRVLFKGRVFDIESVLNVQERGEELVLMCREMV